MKEEGGGAAELVPMYRKRFPYVSVVKHRGPRAAGPWMRRGFCEWRSRGAPPVRVGVKG
jgi:hypothetical protein